jgi:hypothetical protein
MNGNAEAMSADSTLSSPLSMGPPVKPGHDGADGCPLPLQAKRGVRLAAGDVAEVQGAQQRPVIDLPDVQVDGQGRHRPRPVERGVAVDLAAGKRRRQGLHLQPAAGKSGADIEVFDRDAGGDQLPGL